MTPCTQNVLTIMNYLLSNVFHFFKGLHEPRRHFQIYGRPPVQDGHGVQQKKQKKQTSGKAMT